MTIKKLQQLSLPKKFSGCLAISALLGFMANLALPPIGFVPALFIILPWLLLLLDQTKSKTQAFLLGWVFGFAHFIVGLYWVSLSLFTDISQFWWALPFSAAGLPIVLAMFSGAVTLTLYISGLRSIKRLLAFAILWTLGEWLRGHIFTGFPWNLISYSWINVLSVLQMVSIFGSYGLTFFTVLFASMPVLIFWYREKPGIAKRYLIAGTAMLFVFAAAGTMRLALNNEKLPNRTSQRIRIIQPAIPQTLKWDPELQQRNFERHLELSAIPFPTNDPVMIVWPETAIPWRLNGNQEVLEKAASVIPRTGGILITGALRVSHENNQTQFYNSVFAVNKDGEIAAYSDKFHLVPFGEFLPFRKYFPFEPVAAGKTDFSSGVGPTTLHAETFPSFSPLVCYEAIFPGQVADENERPHLLINLTNDAWFGMSIGPHQHFASARIRAIEEGVPLIRAANTGISAVVDPYGRIVALMPLGTTGVIDSYIPERTSSPTLYSMLGDGSLWGELLIAAALLLV